MNRATLYLLKPLIQLKALREFFLMKLVLRAILFLWVFVPFQGLPQQIFGVEFEQDNSTVKRETRDPVTSAKELYELDIEQIKSKLPIVVEGVITMLDSTLWVSFIQDEAGDGVYVYFIDTSEFKEGMKVRVEGTTDLGLYSPYINSEKVTLLEENPPAPEPRSTRVNEIKQGMHDSRLVRITATVRKIQSYLGWKFIEADEHGNRISIVTTAALIQGNLNVGSVIQADGIIGLTLNLNEELSERTGFQMLSQSGFGRIEVLKEGPEDLFDSPEFKIEQLRFLNTAISEGAPLTTEGSVSWIHRNQTLWINDGKFGLPVFLAEPAKSGVQPGDRVRISGFGHDIDGRVHIEDAKFEKIEETEAEEIYYSRIQFPIEKPGQLHGTPSEITGALLSKVQWSDKDALLTMKNDSVRFWVWMQRQDSMLPEVWQSAIDWPAGTQLKIKGILLTRKVPVESSYEWPSQFKNPTSNLSLNFLTQGPELIEVISNEPPQNNRSDIPQVVVKKDDRPGPEGSIALTPSAIGAISAGSALFAGLALFLICNYQSRLKKEILERDEEKSDISTRDALITLAGDWLLTLTEDGKIIHLNDAARRSLNLKDEDRSHKNNTYLENFLSKESVAAFRGVFFEAKRPTQNPTPSSFVELQCNPRGNTQEGPILIEMAFIPVYSGTSLKYFIAYGKDLTLVHDLTSSLRKTEESLRASYESKDRLARDLHDGIVQSVFAIGLSLETCRVQVQRGGVSTARLEESLKAVSEDINRVIREIRGFISEIESGPLSGSELKPAIKSLILTLESFERLHFYLDIEPEASRSLTSREVTQMIFIIREAISNAIRHAKAESVTISLRKVKSSILLEIKDNGVGFDPGASEMESGHGLRNMRSRARELNAEFEIQSDPDNGSTVCVRLRKSMVENLG